MISDFNYQICSCSHLLYLRDLRAGLLLAYLWLAATAMAAPIRITTLDGKSTACEWAGVDAQGRLIVHAQASQPANLSPDDIMSISFPAAQSRPAPASQPADSVTVFLNDGSRFDARVMAGTSDGVTLQTDLLPELKLPLSAVAAIRFARTDVPEAAKAFADALARRDATQDTLFILQDSRVSTLRGVLESIDATGGNFKWRERSIKIDRSRAYGVVLATGAGAPPTPQVRCTLADGSVWAGTLAPSDGTSVTLVLDTGPTLPLPTAHIASLHFRTDRITFLSDLEPAKYEFTPWGTTRWPYRVDTSVTGGPIRIGDEQFDCGIGVHSQCELVYTLNEPFQQFAATVGIDAAVGGRGNVVFRVLADGRELFNSGPVTGRDPGKPVLVSLNGAKTLQLRVEFGDDLDIADRADWGAARLIKGR